ncbi:MAG: type I DNA topoisomerase [Holosporales bacterium]|jgi:DNA topoisomerase-1|nr:type I DNA topoisomerase [Holosporales bacterium]
MKLVLVESPAKAKTINKYLGSEYQVLATYGHVRDLPSKQGSVDPEAGFTFRWELDERGAQQMGKIAKAVKGKEQLLLATDPDREGEAIAWHVVEILREQKALQGMDVQRVAFHAITKSSVLEAIQQPREISTPLVEAYLTRRALDYLVGFTLSPVLWRRLPGSRSAGRVQSVALRLVVEREKEIEAFVRQEFWTITGNFLSPEGAPFEAKLLAIQGEKLEKFSIPDQQTAEGILKQLPAHSPFTVSSLESKRVRRSPFAPFLTSTLQQEASRKLGFSTRRTMQLAQNLYEGVDLNGESVGLITYMRTDSVSVVPEAIQSARALIAQRFGENYVPKSPRLFQNKVKNAQEAHEAIRPTDLKYTPEAVREKLSKEHYALYALIWKRMVASQMAEALFDQTGVNLDNGTMTFRATGSVQVFDGFLRLYEETLEETSDPEGILPPLAEGASTTLQEAVPNQHFTQPPPRFTEASLIKKLEELGIGRPSTYAGILQVLQDRGYARIEKKNFFPEERGRLVTTFLTSFFKTYVEYTFTADLEQKLDDVSNGCLPWKDLLTPFWKGFKKAVDGVLACPMKDVISRLNQELESYLFQKGEDGTFLRECPACKEGELSLKLGRYGAFIGCSRYAECRYTRKLKGDGEESSTASATASARVLGKDASGSDITVRVGRFGPYLQREDSEPPAKMPRGGKTAPQEERARISIPKGISPGEITLDQALTLFSLPKMLGTCPNTGHPVTVGRGRFGAFLRRDKESVSLRNSQDIFTITLEEALTRLESAGKKPASRKRKKA